MNPSTKEMSLNGKLAEYLRQEGLDAVEEQTLQEANGKRHQVDVLVDLDEYAIAIEAEFAPKDGRKDAESRLVDPPLLWRGVPVEASYALRYPKRLQEMLPDNSYQELRSASDITIAYRTRTSVLNTDDGWIPLTQANVSTLADTLRDWWSKADGGSDIDSVVSMASSAIENASAILDRVPQYGEKNSDPAATKALVWLNALLFQELLAHSLDPDDLPHPYTGMQVPRPNPDGDVTDLLQQWKQILQINWWPIFNAARESLKETSPQVAVPSLKILKDTATAIAGQGVIRRHDLAGRIFHRLLDTRKFLATNYTTIPAAILLAGLAFDDQHPLWHGCDWSDSDTLIKLKIVDPACGSGTLLMAAVQELLRRTRRSGHPNNHDTSRIILENSVYGYDVVPAAVHLAASTLSMSETSQLIRDLKLRRMQYGIYGETARLGSLDMLRTSDTEGNAATLGLFDEGPASVAVTGSGEVEETTTVFPRNCDLIIANPPYTRAGGPGDSSNTDWNPIFGSLLDPKDQEKMKDALKRALSSGPAGVYAGLGSAFLVLADENVKAGGRIAFVLPSAVVTGSAWNRIISLLLQKYTVDWVVTSHDPGQRSAKGGVPGRYYCSFSESTSMAETLLVCTKRKPSYPSMVRFVNLRRNPLTAIEGWSLKTAILSQSDHEITLGGVQWGEIYKVCQSELTEQPWPYAAFMQVRLLRQASSILNGQTSSFLMDIPLVQLSDNWSIGPYHMQIKSSRQGIFRCDEGYDPLRNGWPGLWHHKSTHATSLEVLPDAQLFLKHHCHADAATQMLDRASHLHLALELRHTTQRLAACMTSKSMLGIRSWVTLKPKLDIAGAEAMMCLWLNSTPGIFLRLIHANRPYPGRSAMTHTSAAHFRVLDVSSLSPEALRKAKDIFDEIRHEKILPIYQLDIDLVREKIDRVLSEILNLSFKNIRQIAKALSLEPNVCALKK